MKKVKNEKSEDFFAQLQMEMFGMTRDEAQSKSICVSCKTPVNKFKDDISKREYQLSAFCQKCQDNVFG